MLKGVRGVQRIGDPSCQCDGGRLMEADFLEKALSSEAGLMHAQGSRGWGGDEQAVRPQQKYLSELPGGHPYS